MSEGRARLREREREREKLSREPYMGFDLRTVGL